MSSLNGDTFIAAIKQRRTIYALKKESPVTDKRVMELIEQAVLNVPSAFNSQSTRVLALFGADHEYFWEQIVIPAYQKILAPDVFNNMMLPRFKSFAGAHGSIALFEDQDSIARFAQKHASVKDFFPQWSEHTHGMHAFVLWTALELEGAGANLQHMTDLVADAVRSKWSLPQSWKPVAQLVYGGIVAPAGDKTHEPLEQRIKSAGLQ